MLVIVLTLLLLSYDHNSTNATYTSSVVVDAADRRFYEPGDARAFYGALDWRWR